MISNYRELSKNNFAILHCIGNYPTLVENANLNGADAIFVGGSIMMDSFYNERVKKIKSINGRLELVRSFSNVFL